MIVNIDENKFLSLLSFEELKIGLRCEFLALPQFIGLTSMITMTSIIVTWQIHQIKSGKSLLERFSF